MSATKKSLIMGDEEAILLLVDAQSGIAPAMNGWEAVEKNCVKLLQCASIMDMEIAVCEQNPTKLGKTVEKISLETSHIEPFVKMAFSAASCGEFRRKFAIGQHKRPFILCGIEAHVCVLQTALDLYAFGHRVFVVADAITSRRALDRDLAIERLRHVGISIVSMEMVLFEVVRSAAMPKFRSVAALLS